jgi:hypothetical protein
MKQIGFVANPHRALVALSRPKDYLFLACRTDMFEQSPDWFGVFGRIQAPGAIQVDDWRSESTMVRLSKSGDVSYLDLQPE